MKQILDTSVVEYTPESRMRTPRKLVRAMFQNLLNSRELAWRLFVRDTSARFRQSFLGIFWAFLPPIVTGLLFIILQSKKIVNFGETDIPYPVFALIGTTFWQLFTESLNAPLMIVKNSTIMLAKINFPHEALIVSAFYQMIFNLLLKSLVLIGILWYFKVPVSWGFLYAPFAILMLILLGITIGLLLTPVGILYTDISSGLTVITQLWFFVTPVIYPIPKSYPYSLIGTVNPVSPILVGARDLLTKGVLVDGAWFFLISILTIIGLFIAWVIFHISIPILVERMSS